MIVLSDYQVLTQIYKSTNSEVYRANRKSKSPQGTGLGLAISYQIVTQKHQGELTYISTPEKGTKFVIKIPVRQ